MPSYSESFGLVGLEAQACGTAVVAAHQAGLASVVREGVTGFLVDGPDPEAYARRMLRLLEEPGLAERMGERASRMASGLSWQRSADRLLGRLDQLLAGGRGKRPPLAGGGGAKAPEGILGPYELVQETW
jgi:D-inositol-3-phosphate glycosyltransferase